MKIKVKSGEISYQPGIGAYTCKIEAISPQTTQYGDSFLITVEIIQPVTEAGKFWSFFLSQRCSPRSKLGQLIGACGIDLDSLIGQEFELDALMGKTFNCVVVRSAAGFAKPANFFSVVPPF